MILRKRDRLTDTGTGFPYISVTVLTVIVAGCIIGSIVYSDSAYYMQLSEISAAPGRGHIFGTDTLGRDLFSVIWCGGRISLTVGLLATLISTAIAVVYGAAAGLASQRVDDMMMRLTEILMSVPQMLFVMFLQAIMGDANVISISVVIGITGWMAVAKMVRSEVRQLRSSGFVMAARCHGRRILLYTLQTSYAEFHVGSDVHDSDQYRRSNINGGDTELPGAGTACRGGFLGQSDVAVTAGDAFRRMVDTDDPRHLHGEHTDLYNRDRRISQVQRQT